MSSFKFYMLIGFFLMSHICFAAAASLDRVTQGFEDFDEPQEIFQVISKLYKLSQDGSEYKISKNYDKLRYWLSAKACTNLMNSHRIHSLNDKNKNRLAEKMGVQDADKSKFFESIQRYKGFFVPQLGRIFSPASRSRDSINETLMHECIHAYQYLYRLPLDIEALKKSQLLKEEEFVSYLSFYYETEAHWLMHKFSAPKVWVNFAQTQKEGSFAKFLRVVGNAGTVGLANVAGSKSYNDSVPLPDKIGSYDGLSNSNAYWCSKQSPRSRGSLVT